MTMYVHRVIVINHTDPGVLSTISTNDLNTILGVFGEVWRINVSFTSGGPWAGVREIYDTLFHWALREAPDLIEKHSLELAYVVPRCRKSITVRNPTLTDIAPPEEKTRNYAADRVYRIVHGLADLLASWRTRTGITTPLIIACQGFDDCGALLQRFLKELMRREAEAHDIYLIVSSENSAITASLFHPSLHARVNEIDIIHTVTSVESPMERLSPQDAEDAVLEIEGRVGIDRIEHLHYLPELIRLWVRAGNVQKEVGWRAWAVDIYNNLGMYEDALRYGDGLIALIKQNDSDNVELLWKICVKMLMNHIGVQNGVEALHLIRTDASFVRGKYPLWDAQLDYLEAMLHARHLTPRDLALGEALLDTGLRKLDDARLGKEEYIFQRVFNRNGVAMVRSFQGRYEEAITLCEEGLALLDKYLPRENHRLHRSVLLYNIAQVYSSMNYLEEGIASYTKAIEMDPHYSEYYNERGSIYLKSSRLDGALDDYLQAIELGPPYFEVFTNLGQCYRAMGRFEDAVAAYDTALSLEPEQALALIARGKAREELGDTSGAIEDYSAAVNLDESLWDAFASRSVLRYEAGLHAGALADCERAIELSPENKDLYYNRGIVLISMGRRDEGRRDLENVLQAGATPEDEQAIKQRLKESTLSISYLSVESDQEKKQKVPYAEPAHV